MMWLKAIMCILITLSAVCVTGAVISWVLFDYSYEKKDSIGTLKFKTFLELYAIAENKWELESCTVKYYEYCTDIRFGTPYRYHFSLPDTVCYVLWRHQEKRRIQADSNREKMEKAVALWQRDIKKYCEENGVPTKEDSNG